MTLANRDQVSSAPNHRDVFVVHGRNLVARDAVFEFLDALDLHPMEWSEIVSATGSGSPYVGDVLDAAFSKARAVVVLLTPDDEARLRELFHQADEPAYETELTGQARPNVLFEAGMAMARDQRRTILVQIGEVRPFSDIGGRHVLHLENTAESRNQFAHRLEAAGCAVKTSGDRWLSAGDFASALIETPASQNKSREVVVGKKGQNSPPALAEDQAGGQSDERILGLSLSQDSLELLTEAYAGKPGAYITRVRMGGRLQIKTTGRIYVDAPVADPEAKRWNEAVTALFDEGLVENNKSDTYYLTSQGSAFLEAIARQ